MPTAPDRRHPARTSALVLSLIALPLAATLLFAAPGSAAQASPAPPMTQVPVAAPSAPTPEDLQGFLDTQVPELLARYDVPGAAATVVADGAPAASGTYGYADPSDETPYTEEHLLPTGSVAKSFTAVAVLQLVDEGVLDLDEDVNAYLPEQARLPDTFDEPVTLHHLLTHTAGFEDRLGSTAVTDPDDLLALDEYVRDTDVERVHPPGRYSLYSNHGVTLAGYIVQQQTGIPFADGLRETLFDPLGMADTAFVQLSEVDPERLPTPHHPDGSRAAGLYLHQTPAGAAVTTTADMARFMTALLSQGELDGMRVLSASSVDAMFESQWALTSAASGVGYGSWEYRQESPRVVGHSGDLPGHHAEYFLVPEAGLGLFVGSNAVVGPDSEVTDHLIEFRVDLRRAFLDAFAPPNTSVPADPDAEVDLDRYTGTFLNLRLSESEASRLRALSEFVLVDSAPGGGLTVLSGPGAPLTLRPAGNGVFVSEDGLHRVVFGGGSEEASSLMFTGSAITTYERVGPLSNPLVHQSVLSVSLLVLATCLVWPLTALVRRLRKRPPHAPRRALWARLTAFAALLGSGVTFGAVGYVSVDMDASYRWLFEGSPMLGLPLLLTAPFLLGMVVWAVMAWAGRWWSVVGRIHYSFIALTGPALLAFGVYYRLLWPLN